MPDDEMMSLEGTIPLPEMLVVPISHELLAMKDDEHCLVVMKRGRTMGLTVGIALDMRTMHRTSPGDEVVESLEWTIIHRNMKRYDPSRPLERLFSAEGDSGPAIFDPEGRVGGLLTGGTGSNGRKKFGPDMAYATLMVHVLAGIERELEMPVHIL